MSRHSRAELLLVVASFIWGSTFVIVKGALADASPFPFLALRFTLAGVLMWLVMARGRFDRQALVPSLVLGLLLFCGYALQTWGLIFTTPSKSAFITGFSVIVVPMILLFRGYRMGGANLGGALLGMSGLYFLVLPSSVNVVNRGDMLTLVGAICFAAHIVLVGVYTRRVSFLHLAPAQILVVGVLATLALAIGPPWVLHWTARLGCAIGVTAVFATGFAFGAQFWAQQYTPPAHAALIFTLEPVFAGLTSRVVTGERLGGKLLLGALLILAGMIISEIWGSPAPTPVEG